MSATPQRPNILWIVSEDCPPRLGAYGDTLAQTPNLDGLARNGITFDTACCTSPVCSPSRFAILTGRHAESHPPIQQMRAEGKMPDGVTTYPELMRAAGWYCTNNLKTDYNCDVDLKAIWDDSSDTAHWRNRPEGAPFLAVFNCIDTHESCVFSDQRGQVGPDDVTVPAYLPDTEGTRRALARYYNRIAQMDRYMGERLRELEADGVAGNTIVLYHSDHGSPLPRSKRFCYDEGLRVPFIIRLPERWRQLRAEPPGARVAAPVSLVDMLPTLAKVARLDVPAGVQGQSFLGTDAPRDHVFSGRDRMDERYDMTRTVRSARFRYIRNYAPHRICGQHYAFAWNNAAYQDYEAAHLAQTLTPLQDRFWQRKPAEELYDMHADPDSTVSLCADPQHAGVLADLRAALDTHMRAIRDGGFAPEGSAAESQTDDPQAYPLEEVMALAGQAIARDPNLITDFVAGLTHPSLVMRYWSAQGLLMLAIDGHAMPDGVAKDLDREGDPHVRVALAEALGHGGDAEKQVALLTRIVAEETAPRLRLQALNALTWLPLHPEITLDIATRAAVDTDEYVRGAAEYLRLLLRGEYRPDSTVFNFDMFKGPTHVRPMQADAKA